MHNYLKNKIFQSFTDFSTQLENWKKENLSLVFTNGCFDLLHPGHVDYLQKAKDLGDKLIVGINSDASVSRIKGSSRPIQHQNKRATVMAGLAATNAVVLFEEDTPEKLIQFIAPNILVKGGDYKINEIKGREVVFENRGSVVLLSVYPENSTSSIIERIINLQKNKI
jgi:rfaE bifunctional protein nucleotidyltransferase chain/domain